MLLRKLQEHFVRERENATLKFLLTSRPLPPVLAAFSQLEKRFDRSRRGTTESEEATSDLESEASGPEAEDSQSERSMGEDARAEQGHGMSTDDLSFFLIEDDDATRTLIRQDVDRVLAARLDFLTKEKRLSRGERETLLQNLQRDSISATYLWVELVFEELQIGIEHGLARKEWLDLARSLPQTVEEMYTKILSKAMNLKETRILLHLLLAAKRPLHWREANVALEIWRRPGYKCFDDFTHLEHDKDVFQDQLRASVGLLVTLHGENLHFIHQTAREFLLRPEVGLESVPNAQPLPSWTSVPNSEPLPSWIAQTFVYLFSWWQSMTGTSPTEVIVAPCEETVTSFHSTWGAANLTLAEICLAYLSLEVSEELKESYRSLLWDYALTGWYEHFNESTVKPIKSLESFMGSPNSPSPAYVSWSISWSNHSVAQHYMYRTWADRGQRDDWSHGRHFFSRRFGGPSFQLGYLDPSEKSLFREGWKLRDLIPLSLSESLQTTRPKDCDEDIANERIWRQIQQKVLDTIFGTAENPQNHIDFISSVREQVDSSDIEEFFKALQDISPEIGGRVACSMLTAFCNQRRSHKKPGIALSFVEHGPLDSVPVGVTSRLMIMAAAQGSQKHIQRLLDHGVHVNVVVEQGDSATALIAAIDSGNFDNFKVLLSNPELDVNLAVSSGMHSTALIAGCVQHDSRFVMELINSKAEVDQLALIGEYGTALIAATSTGRHDNVDDLLKRTNVDVNTQAATGISGTALIAACVRGNRGLVDRLVDDKKAAVDATANIGEYATALIAACAGNNIDMVRRLLKKGADVNIIVAGRNPPSALDAAVISQSAWAVLQLLERNVDVTNLAWPIADDGTNLTLGRPQASTELNTREGYRSAASYLRTALMLFLLQSDGSVERSWIKEVSQTLSRGADTIVNQDAAEDTASVFGMVNPMPADVEKWHHLIRAFAPMDHDYREIMPLLRDLLVSLDRNRADIYDTLDIRGNGERDEEDPINFMDEVEIGSDSESWNNEDEGDGNESL